MGIERGFPWFFKCVFCVCEFLKVWDDNTVMSGHYRMYSSGYRRLNRKRHLAQNEDCDKIEILGTLPSLGECIRKVKNHTCIFSTFFGKNHFLKPSEVSFFFLN